MKTKLSVLMMTLVLVVSVLINPSTTLAGRGCCSWHGGQSYCDVNTGRWVCNDGTYSPTCMCNYIPTYTPTYQPVYTPPAPVKPEYDYEWVSQSDYPTIGQGAKTTMTLKVRNTGTAWWYNHDFGEIHLATVEPTDRNSGFFIAGNWLSTNRAAKMVEDHVIPGDVATFTFDIQGNPSVGIYPEHFSLVAENKAWMPNKGIFWNIRVI